MCTQHLCSHITAVETRQIGNEAFQSINPFVFFVFLEIKFPDSSFPITFRRFWIGLFLGKVLGAMVNAIFATFVPLCYAKFISMRILMGFPKHRIKKLARSSDLNNVVRAPVAQQNGFEWQYMPTTFVYLKLSLWTFLGQSTIEIIALFPGPVSCRGPCARSSRIVPIS
jgi:hypothetical protein